MDTYPCPACGGVASDVDGCRACGRAHDPVAAALARLNDQIAGLEDETRRLAEGQSHLRAQRQQMQAQRAALARELAQRLAQESGSLPKPPRPSQTRPAPPTPTTPRPAPAETSARSAQNTLLSLGGVLVAIAVIAITWVFYTTAQTGGRAFILGICTTLALGIPVLLARRTLTATAETIAGLGLLLVLLDGYAAYSSDLADLANVPRPLYVAILLALVAGVAAAYRLATHLRAPQFAALLAVQPLLPLLAVWLHASRDGYALVLAVVAAQNLGAVELFRRDITLARTAARAPTAARTTTGSWPRMLRELAWALFGLALVGSVAVAVSSEVEATTPRGAVRASLVLLLAAAIGVVAGQQSRRPRMVYLATAAAALAVVGAVTRIGALALPHYTLLVSTAIAAAVAVAAGYLPAGSRGGWRVGSLIGAALAALVVAGNAVATATATVHAAVSPMPWAADVLGYLDRVRGSSWQVPVAALLLTVLAAAAVPRSRLDAAAGGAFFVVLAAPATGALTWWAVPLLATATAIAALMAALYASSARSVVLRASSSALLGLYAVATSLARPELTAAVCSTLALVAATTTVVTAGWPDRFGRYASRVADAAGGAAAFTLPVAVGTFAWIGGAGSDVLLPMTLLATALGVLGAAVSQVAARQSRTGSAGGALVASVGCLVLSLVVDGTALVDRGLAVLLLMAGLATAASRALRLSEGGLVEGITAVPAAVSALADSVDGEVDRPEAATRRPRTVDGVTLGAALATASVILALARLLAVAVPGIGLVTTTAMVFVVSLAVVALPENWRRGPRLGAGVVAGIVGLATAGVAVAEAARTIAATGPFWAASLELWPAAATAWAPYGWQVPASLLLAAAAAWALVPAPNGGDVAFGTLALAGLAAPAALALPWWSPILITGTLAVLAGLAAAVTGPATPGPVVRRRLAAAAVLGLYATVAASVGPGPTAVLLSGVVAAGAVVAATAYTRHSIVDKAGSTVEVGGASLVAGVAAAAALLAAPGAGATIAVVSGATRVGVLGVALTLAAFGVLVLAALRAARTGWGGYPALAVGAAALVVALASAPDPRHAEPRAQLWAAAAALVAACAAATVRVRDRATVAVIVVTSAPAALLAAVASAPAWLTAVTGPYQTLRRVWQGYPAAAQPQNARTAMLTLLLLAAVAATVALTVGGQRYLLSAMLPPLAALALVVPSALGAPPPATPWVCLGIALAAGLGAALSPPTLPAAARLLRGTAGVVCAVTGAAGLAGALATRSGTLAALSVVLVAAVAAARLGRDPSVRMVAWLVAAGAGYALPVAGYAAAGRSVRPAAFAILAVSGLLIAVAALLARPGPAAAPRSTTPRSATSAATPSPSAARGTGSGNPAGSPGVASARDAPRSVDGEIVDLPGAGTKPARGWGWGGRRARALRAARESALTLRRRARTALGNGRVNEAAAAELAAAVGAVLALLLTLGSARHAAAVLTIWGLLLGGAALRRDRSAIQRQWLVRAALVAELAACWLLLYSVDVGLPEAYTLPFAAVAVLAGAVELRRRPDLSSWTAYGGALAGGFLPSLALVLIGQDPVWRWVTLFAAAIVAVIVGSWRRRRAPVVAGAGLAVLVAVTEMIRLLLRGELAGAILVAVTGLVLIVLGALSEQRLRGALRKMS